MKVLLNIAERIALFGVLPEEGSIVTLRTVEGLRMQTSFTDNERKDWRIKEKQTPSGLMIVWDSDFNTVKTEFDINDAAKSLIYMQLVKMSDEGRLRMETISLYEKFVEGKV